MERWGDRQGAGGRLAGLEPDWPKTAVFTGTSSVPPNYLLVKLFQTGQRKYIKIK